MNNIHIVVYTLKWWQNSLVVCCCYCCLDDFLATVALSHGVALWNYLFSTEFHDLTVICVKGVMKGFRVSQTLLTTIWVRSHQREPVEGDREDKLNQESSHCLVLDLTIISALQMIYFMEILRKDWEFDRLPKVSQGENRKRQDFASGS